MSQAHCVRCKKNGCFTIVGINLIHLQSPDINVIENHLERAVQKHQITSKEQLKSVFARRMVEYFPIPWTSCGIDARRLEAVISAKGYATKY
ncbi:hypothetical protein TNCV_783811 [Trichonephila clavipes]|nr:hypothetical protein TNCV_783811 [Trichonephila clavipes]